ncbi:MAG: transporter substrate-binding domain-containing protein [Methylocystaceae bacterium]|nr:transporter substrate-binding domain-containing protein [Methylocystaceae bacterium]
MMSGFLKCSFVLSLLVYAVVPAKAAGDLNRLILAVEDSWPPFSKRDGSGLSNQIVQEAYETQNIKVDFVVAPYARQLVATEKGAYVGAFNVTKEPSTQEKFHFCEERLFKATTSYYVNEDAPLKARTYEELNSGEKIGVIIGYEYGPFIIANNKVKKFRVSKQSNLIKMLLKKRLDAVLMFDAIAQYTLPQIQNSHKIKRAFEGQHSDIYVAFSKKHDDAGYFCK